MYTYVCTCVLYTRVSRLLRVSPAGRAWQQVSAREDTDGDLSLGLNKTAALSRRASVWPEIRYLPTCVAARAGSRGGESHL